MPIPSETIAGPLRGIRVLDATTMLAGPYAATLLADFGADVVKLEDVRGGDPMRQTPPIVDGQHVASKSTNRNKRSITVDLRDARGRAIYGDLARTVDVVMTNFRPATLREWRLDYDDIVASNPTVVMYHLTAFGRTGPYADRPGFAKVAEAFAGLTYISGEPDRSPMFAGFPIADGIAGAHGAYAVLLALFERQRTGRGQLVDIALYEPLLRMLDGVVTAYDVTGVVPERAGTENRDIAPNGLFRAGDGEWIVLPVSSPNMWTRCCTALGLEHLVDDPRFATNFARVEHRRELNALLQEVFDRTSGAELLAALQSHGVAAGPVNSMRDVCADRHLWEVASLVRVHDELLGREVTMPNVVPRLSQTPGRIERTGPEPGTHSRAILRDVLGYDATRIVSLLEAGVVTEPRR